ncbi:MAG: tetratricopeptide repeat protein [Arenicellales bacterium]|nr:tetratricopeptide repeat protein [Arenicellales bacterium]
MIDPRFSEDEQAERLKEWWKKNGTSVIVGVVIGVSAIVGVNLWRNYTQTQAESASSLFTQLLSSQGEEAQKLGNELLADYDNTPYAALAALYLAKIHYEKGDTGDAERRLSWALENSKQVSNQHVARLRLARVYLDTDRVGKAEELVDIKQYDGFESEYKELLGDIAMLKGDAESARSAYEDALNALPRGSRFSELLVLKRDHAIGESTQ